MFINSIDNINAVDEVSFYCTLYQFSEQFVTNKLVYGKSGPVFCLHIARSLKYCLTHVGSRKR